MGISLLEILLQTNKSLKLGVIQAFTDSSSETENKYSRSRALQGAYTTHMYIRNADASVIRLRLHDTSCST